MKKYQTIMKIVLFVLMTLSVMSVDSQGQPTRTVDNPKVVEDMKKGIAAYDRGLQFIEEKKYDLALYEFKTAISEFEVVGDSGRGTLAAAANNAGNVLLLKNEPKKAEDFFVKANKADPENALAINNLGSAMLKQGDVKEALLKFQKAIEVDPNLAIAYGNTAEVLVELGNLSKAAKYLAVAITLQPDSERYLLLMARIYSLAGLKDKQKKAWEALVKVSDGSLAAKTEVVASYITSGMIAEAEMELNELAKDYSDAPEVKLQQARLMGIRGKWREAEALLKVLVERFPSDQVSRRDLVVSLIKQGQMKDAIAMARVGTQKFPLEAENWFVLGQSYEAAGDLSEAQKAYHKVVEMDASHAKALNNLGILAAKKKKTEEALQYFSSAVSADPYYTDALYNLGRALVISMQDYERGIRLLASVAQRKGKAAVQARAFLAELEKIANGQDPEWNGKVE